MSYSEGRVCIGELGAVVGQRLLHGIGVLTSALLLRVLL